VLLNIHYGGAMAESGGGFKVDRHHMTMTYWVFCGGGGHFMHHVMTRWIGKGGKNSGGAAAHVVSVACAEAQ